MPRFLFNRGILVIKLFNSLLTIPKNNYSISREFIILYSARIFIINNI